MEVITRARRPVHRSGHSRTLLRPAEVQHAGPVADGLFAGALAMIGVLGTYAVDGLTGVDRRIDAMALALVIVACGAVAVRRRVPVPALLATAVLLSAYLLLGYPYGPVFFPFVVAVYTVAAHRELAPAVRAVVPCLAVLLLHLFTHQAAISGFLGVVPTTAWVVAPFAVGVTVRLTREARRREHAEAVRARVDDERLRIAQEVHDVVGHGLAAIKMQADIALHLLGRKPEQAEQALVAISRTSTEALDEVRATLAVVRRTGADRVPTPGLARLDDLVQRMIESGMQVDVHATGTPRPLPPAAELTCYRLVQESLTNVLRHAPGQPATVRIVHGADAVTVEITNPVSAPPDGERGAGFGLTGMSERVTALGGEFDAGPTRDGGFRVHATIPTRDAA